MFENLKYVRFMKSEIFLNYQKNDSFSYWFKLIEDVQIVKYEMEDKE